MHVVIAGCGRVGSSLTVNLVRQGHTVSIIDQQAKKFERLPPGFEGQTLVGKSFDQATLEQAGIKEAGAFLAVTDGDNSNIVSARIAQEHYAVPRVIARIDDPRRAEIYRRLGIQTVATVRWAAAEIYDMLFHGVEQAEMAICGGELVLLKVEINAMLAGSRVSALGEPGIASVVALDRRGDASLPAPDATLQEGDVAHIVVARDGIENLRARLEGHHL